MKMVSVEAADGTQLRHRVWPSADPEATVVLLNGVMSHSLWFEPITPHLPHLDLVGADRRGTGENDHARGDTPSAETLVDDTVRIVEFHQSDRLFLLGWCWGAVLALNVIHRIRADGLILVASGLHPTEAVAAAARADDTVIPIKDEMFTRGPALEDFIKKDTLRLRSITPSFTKAMRRLAMTAAGRMRKLSVPVLVIVADDDEATDSDAAASAIPGAEVVRIPGPHGLMFDAPDALAAAIASFVERH